MAISEFDPYEVDAAFQVEEGIRKALTIHPWATVQYSAIDVFEVVTPDGKTLDAAFDAKCRCLCDRLECTFEKNDDTRTCRFILKNSGLSST